MALDWANLEREVTETEGVVDSAIVFIKAIRDELTAINTDGNPRIAAVVAKLDAKQTALADAIAANPEPPPPVE